MLKKFVKWQNKKLRKNVERQKKPKIKQIRQHKLLKRSLESIEMLKNQLKRL